MPFGYSRPAAIAVRPKSSSRASTAGLPFPNAAVL
jgi:hypothetical protein